MKLPLIIFILLLSHTPFLSKAQTFQYFYGNYVYDLYPDTSADFSSMTTSWKLNNFAGTAAMTRTCQLTASETVPMFGGIALNSNPDSTGVPDHIDKEYSSLPTHQSVYYQVEVMVINSINAGLEIYIDSSQNFLVYPRNYIVSDTMITCDSSSYVAVTLIGSATHSASTLTFKVRSPANYLFGIRDVQISFSPDAVSASASNCMVIQTAANRVTSAGICACGSDEYYSSVISSCASCNPSCSSCFGPDASDCFGCTDGICGSASTNTGSTDTGTSTTTSTNTLSASEQSTIKTTTQTASSVSDVTSTLGKAISVINFSNPGAIFMASFVQMIRYIKYLRIDYPEKLQYSLDLQLDLPIQIIPDPPDSLNNYLVSAPIPENFEGDYSSSSFFWNFWNDLITLAALGLAIVLVLLIKPCTGKYKRLHSLITEAHQALLWNFSLPFFASSFADIVLFSSFELQTADYSVTTGLSIFSLVLCCAFNLLAIIAFIKMVHTVQTHYYQVIKTMDPSIKKVTQKRLSSYQVVYECCKKKSFSQQAFMPIFVGRIYLFVAVIAYLYNYPVMQALIIMLLSLLMLLYLLLTRPVQGWVDMANYVLQELVTLLVLLCTLILAGLDSSDPSNNTVRDNLADVIIDSNLAFCGISLVYLVIQLVPLLKNGFEQLVKCLRKSKPNKNMEEGKLKIQQVPRLNHSPNTSIDPLRDIEPIVDIHGIFENSSPQANFAKRVVKTKSYNRSPPRVRNAVNY